LPGHTGGLLLHSLAVVLDPSSCPGAMDAFPAFPFLFPIFGAQRCAPSASADDDRAGVRS
ncbi:hypothetical protein OFO11_30625, partial [Escherichia coli]|nr:hypothetical protein [Escherichia coli]